MFVSIVIIKLIINLILWYYCSCSVYCFKNEKISARSLVELEKVYKITQETLPWRSSFDL